MFFLVLLLVISHLNFQEAKLYRDDEFQNLIYKTFDVGDHSKISFCIRRFNLTKMMGCTSTKSGNIGFLVPYSSRTIDRIPSGSKSILMIDVVDFRAIKILPRLVNRNKDVNGVILYQRSSVSRSQLEHYRSFSHDSVCPNQNYGMKNTTRHCDHVWNPQPNPYLNFAHIEWPIPIFLVRNSGIITRLNRCGKTPNCMVQLKSFMYGTGDSRRCLNRGNTIVDIIDSTYCKPIRAHNIFSTFFTLHKDETVQNRTVLMLTARLDSFTMFESWSPGANSVYSSLIVFLAVAHTLRQHYREIETNRKQGRNILYALFDAESFGYVGSGSWAFFSNLNQSDNDDFITKFPTSTIVQALELNQLFISRGKKPKFWVHGNWSGKGSNAMADSFLRILGNGPGSKSYGPIPPSTVSMLRRFDPNISAILVSGYDSIFDPFVHSLFDKSNFFELRKEIPHLKNLATAVTQFLYEFLTGKSKATVEVNLSLVRNLTRCFFQRHKRCQLFDGQLKLENVNFELTAPTQREVDIILGHEIPIDEWRIISKIKLKKVIEVILFYANGKKVFCKEETGKQIPIGANRTEVLKEKFDEHDECISSQTMMFSLESPYIDYLGKSFYPNPDELRHAIDQLTGVDFSTWTESRYSDKSQPYIRIFIVQSKSFQFTLVIIGFALTLISACTVRYVEKNLDRFFDFKSDEPIG